MVAFGPKGSILEKVVVLGQNRLYSGKVVVFGQKKVVFRQGGCIRANVVVIR